MKFTIYIFDNDIADFFAGKWVKYGQSNMSGRFIAFEITDHTLFSFHKEQTGENKISLRLDEP